MTNAPMNLPKLSLTWEALGTYSTVAIRTELAKMVAAEAALLGWRRESIISQMDLYNVTPGEVVRADKETGGALEEALEAARYYTGPIQFLEEEIERREWARLRY
tara:strand:- start:346 stop:660 length:315 start_codon:yes stop_codon:yes gene_type:complete